MIEWLNEELFWLKMIFLMMAAFMGALGWDIYLLHKLVHMRTKALEKDWGQQQQERQT